MRKQVAAAMPRCGSVSSASRKSAHREATVVTAQQLLEREGALKSAVLEYRRVLAQTVYAIGAVEARHDPYTARHQRSVGALSFAIGRELGLERDRLEGLYLGALLHDIGKMVLPREILRKPGRLSEEEYALVKTHVQAGCDILAHIVFPWPVRAIVAQHHERLDGSGYPQGLTADAICLDARIVAVADVFSALCEQRPYRQASGVHVALEELERCAGTTLDAQVVHALQVIVAGKPENHLELMSRLRADLSDADLVACLGG